MMERIDALILESHQMRIGFEEVIELMRERNAAFQSTDESEVTCG